MKWNVLAVSLLYLHGLPTRSLCPIGIFPGKNIWVRVPYFLQGILPVSGNPGLYSRADASHLKLLRDYCKSYQITLFIFVRHSRFSSFLQKYRVATGKVKPQKQQLVDCFSEVAWGYTVCFLMRSGMLCRWRIFTVTSVHITLQNTQMKGVSCFNLNFISLGWDPVLKSTRLFKLPFNSKCLPVYTVNNPSCGLPRVTYISSECFFYTQQSGQVASTTSAFAQHTNNL